MKIPKHLAKFEWYAEHQAWLKAMGCLLRHNEPKGTTAKRADLRGADLRDAVLRGAVLRGADLRGADLSGAVLRGAVLRGADLSDAVLRGAVLRGADLSGAVLRGAVLRGADLRDADLRDAVLSDAVLRGAVLRGADLSGAVLRGAVLRGADLSGAVLRGAVLRDADLRDAKIQVVPSLHAQMVELIDAGKGRLNMRDWHTCDTTHCRGGWAVNLAGEAGSKLEKAIGTPAAAALIITASCPSLKGRVPDFYCGDAEAMKQIRELAAVGD